MENKKKKKPFYKRWWFIAILVIVIATALFGGGDESEDTAEEVNKEETTEVANTSDETESVEESEEVEETEEVEEEETYVNTAEQTELFTGEFMVGEDIAPGRYEITSEDGSGNFFVYEGEMPVVNEILEKDRSMGITRLQVELEERQRIEISGINKVMFKPATIEMKTTLPAGNHLVGRDVPAGKYIAQATEGSGNFFVYEGSMPVVNEILGDASIGVEKINLNLKEGQVVNISGIESVELTE